MNVFGPTLSGEKRVDIMGCARCGKKGARSAPPVNMVCEVCGITLTCKAKDVLKINGHTVCGICYKRYKICLKFEEK